MCQTAQPITSTCQHCIPRTATYWLAHLDTFCDIVQKFEIQNVRVTSKCVERLPSGELLRFILSTKRVTTVNLAPPVHYHARISVFLLTFARSNAYRSLWNAPKAGAIGLVIAGCGRSQSNAPHGTMSGYLLPLTVLPSVEVPALYLQDDPFLWLQLFGHLQAASVPALVQLGLWLSAYMLP